MLPLLFPFIADTVIAPPLDYKDLFVNEWGVVVFTPEGTAQSGAPAENYGPQAFEGLEVDAPVIWIHGAFFDDATITVKAVQGSLTTIFPRPDSISGDDETVTASWNISALPPEPRKERPALHIPPGTPFAWAMDFWRNVPSLDLFSSTTGKYIGNFIYYETEIPVWEAPYDITDAVTFAGHYAPDGLLITTGEEPRVERIQMIPFPGVSGAKPGQLSEEEICDTFCGWAAGNLKSQEIETIWQTWEPFFSTSTDEFDETTEKWILFPLPWDTVEKISTIHLEVHDSIDREITYNRLFLGLVKVH